MKPVDKISDLSPPRRAWLKAYLRCLNQTEAARKSYKTTNNKTLWEIGSKNFRICSKLIGKWLDEHGLSEEALRARLYKGMDARETKFFAYRTKDKETGEETQVIDQIEVEAIGEQRRYLEMGMRAKGMFDKDNAQRKTEISIPLTNFPPEPKSLEEWEATYKAAREARKGEKE